MKTQQGLKVKFFEIFIFQSLKTLNVLCFDTHFKKDRRWKSNDTNRNQIQLFTPMKTQVRNPEGTGYLDRKLSKYTERRTDICTKKSKWWNKCGNIQMLLSAWLWQWEWIHTVSRYWIGFFPHQTITNLSLFPEIESVFIERWWCAPKCN